MTDKSFSSSLSRPELPTFIYDPDSRMPVAAQVQNHRWNVAARECYAARNAATGRVAEAYHECGDVYLLRALAITAEWYET